MQMRAAIQAIAYHLPEQRLTNDHLTQEHPEWDMGKVYEKTGIWARAIAKPDECASDLGVTAAQKLFAHTGYLPQDIDFLLFCSQTPDYFLPATACIIQHRLGLRTTCGAMDINLGCSGFIYGLALAKGLIESGACKNVLLITAETYSKLLHPSDRKNRALFGDGAAATLIGSIEADREFIGPFVFGTDGSGARELIVSAGGMRVPLAPENAAETETEPGIFRSPRHLYMNGPGIFSFTARIIPKVISQLVIRSGVSLQEIDFFVFHQASRLILDHLRQKIKVPEDKFCIHLKEMGNTVSSSIPITIEAYRDRGSIKEGLTLMLVGFGVGLSWGATLVRIPDKSRFVPARTSLAQECSTAASGERTWQNCE